MPADEKPKVRIFISYSRDDTDIVESIVTILRVAEANVFLDVQSIAPGALWQKEIYKAIDEAEKICVFWCIHSLHSEWVEQEWRYAANQQKTIIPIVLDETYLPDELEIYQRLVLRPIVRHQGLPGFRPSDAYIITQSKEIIPSRETINRRIHKYKTREEQQSIYPGSTISSKHELRTVLRAAFTLLHIIESEYGVPFKPHG